MKLIKRLGKLVFAITALLYALCLFNGENFFEYTVTEQGGVISVAGQSLEINTEAATTIRETYTQAEAQASEWLPKKLKATVRRLYSILSP